MIAVAYSAVHYCRVNELRKDFKLARQSFVGYNQVARKNVEGVH